VATKPVAAKATNNFADVMLISLILQLLKIRIVITSELENRI
jgi:hypothetical protein